MDDHDGDASLWEMLQISREDALPPLDDSMWDTVLQAALDPEAPEADNTLVPIHDDQHGIIDPAWGNDHDAAAGGDEEHHDLAGLLHDAGAGSHDLGSLDHQDHEFGHHDLSEHHDLGGHDAGHHEDGFGQDHPDLGGFDHLG